jgi:hypothetical protein
MNRPQAILELFWREQIVIEENAVFLPIQYVLLVS